MARPPWLVLVHHLPHRPTRLRVRVWRQLQRLGAVAVKNSVYVLPFSDKTLEDFTWLRQEIEAGGGEAVLFQAFSVIAATDEEITAAFRKGHDAAYARLAADLDAICRRMKPLSRESGQELDELDKEMNAMQTRFDTLDATDFFKAPARGKAEDALAKGRSLLRAAAGKTGRGSAAIPGPRQPHETRRYQGRLWITRPRPHIDRCATAWLIRRFIDRRPRFGFAVAGGDLRGGIPYDMPGAEFSHRGEDCTFETMLKHFGLQRDPALRVIAQIVHDVDLKDGKFGRAEAVGVNVVLRGLAERVSDDQRLLRESEPVFDGLYATLTSKPDRRRRSAARKGK